MVTPEELQDFLKLPEKGKNSIIIEEGKITWKGNEAGCRVGKVMINADALLTQIYIPRMYGGGRVLKLLNAKLKDTAPQSLIDVRITQIDDTFIQFNRVDISGADKPAAGTGQMMTLFGLSMHRFHENDMFHITTGPKSKDNRWNLKPRRILLR